MFIQSNYHTVFPPPPASKIIFSLSALHQFFYSESTLFALVLSFYFASGKPFNFCIPFIYLTLILFPDAPIHPKNFTCLREENERSVIIFRFLYNGNVGTNLLYCFLLSVTAP